ncbi:UNVERIFIED_CONTAM: hypothetical protein HDU68_010313 [Siphonaria sp. JEL0065]|nr:hypothetical protein HDU68_010313 [Siphonaria sp. JEL0065]
MGHAGNVEKMVSFSINGPDEQKKSNDKKAGKASSGDEAKESLQKEITELTNAIQKVTDEQAYIRQRLLRHHDSTCFERGESF